MATFSKQNQRAGLVPTQLGGRKIAVYDPEVMLKVVEKVAEGKLLRDIVTEAGMPTLLTIHQWTVIYPEARRAMQAAREISAQAFEEEALSMGRQISQEPGNSQKVRAFEVLLNQLRWSAGRRNPRLFGDQKQTAIVVPVQINTTLSLGDGGVGAGTDEYPNIYEMTVTTKKEEPIDVESKEVPVEEPLIQPAGERVPLGRPHKVALTPRPAPTEEERRAREAKREERLVKKREAQSHAKPKPTDSA